VREQTVPEIVRLHVGEGITWPGEAEPCVVEVKFQAKEIKPPKKKKKKKEYTASNTQIYAMKRRQIYI
jgi:hypothetical protein